MPLSSHTFEYDINLSADEIYSKTLQAIKKLDYKLIDEDKKNKSIIAKTKMESSYWAQNLTIDISNKFISIKAEVNQYVVYRKSKEISDSIITQISKSAKIRLSTKNKKSESQEKLNVKNLYWMGGLGLILLIFLFSLSGGRNQSGVGSQSGKSDDVRCFYHSQRPIDATKEIECNYKCDGWVKDEKLWISRYSTCPLTKW